MEIAHKNNDQSESIARIKAVLTNCQRAEIMAQNFRERTLGQPFTSNHLAYLLKTSIVDAEARLTFCSSFGLIGVKQDEGKAPMYKIIQDDQERLKIMRSSVQYMVEKHRQDMELFTAIISIIETKEATVNGN